MATHADYTPGILETAAFCSFGRPLRGRGAFPPRMHDPAPLSLSPEEIPAVLDKSLIGHAFPTCTIDVEKRALRFFAKAIGETDPIYTDEAAARDAGYPSLPVPPTFLHCLESQASDPHELIAIARLVLGRILHAEQQFTYHAMAHAGDRLKFEAKIVDVYSKKGGALEFVVKESRVSNQHGTHIADIRVSLVQRNL
jgi:acyl dehydratase